MKGCLAYFLCFAVRVLVICCAMSSDGASMSDGPRRTMVEHDSHNVRCSTPQIVKFRQGRLSIALKPSDLAAKWYVFLERCSNMHAQSKLTQKECPLWFARAVSDWSAHVATVEGCPKATSDFSSPPSAARWQPAPCAWGRVLWHSARHCCATCRQLPRRRAPPAPPALTLTHRAHPRPGRKTRVATLHRLHDLLSRCLSMWCTTALPGGAEGTCHLAGLLEAVEMVSSSDLCRGRGEMSQELRKGRVRTS